MKTYFKICFSSIFVLLICFSANAQNIEYGRALVDTLCSPYFAGRGYTKNGHKKAADFIEAEFKKAGLSTLDKDKAFQQKFKISANTYPGKLSLKINGKALQVGKDFIVDPSSPGGKGKMRVVSIDTSTLRTEAGLRGVAALAKKGKKALYINNENGQYRNAIFGIKESEQPKLLLESSKQKLTWHISTGVKSGTYFKIKDEAIKQPIKKVEYEIENVLKQNIETQNVVGMVKGTEYPDSFFVFTAHYDHLGQLGENHYIPGANDNASGTAMLINLAKHYAENPAPYSIVFIAFGGEELGLFGSKHFVESWWMELEKIKFLVNLDIVGGGEDGVQIVNSRQFTDAYAVMDSINKQHKYLKQLKLRGTAQNSDHWHFYDNGVPCFFIYTLGGPPYYHDVFDIAETLPLTEYEDLIRLLIDFVSVY